MQRVIQMVIAVFYSLVFAFELSLQGTGGQLILILNNKLITFFQLW